MRTMRSFSVDEHVLFREIRQRTAASHTQDTGCETYRWRFLWDRHVPLCHLSQGCRRACLVTRRYPIRWPHVCHRCVLLHCVQNWFVILRYWSIFMSQRRASRECRHACLVTRRTTATSNLCGDRSCFGNATLVSIFDTVSIER